MEKEKLEELLKLNVNEFTEKKNNLTYLSWAMAWREFVKVYPDAEYTIKKREDGLPCFGNSELGYMCYTTVKAGGTTHEMWLPVMDYRNKSMTSPTSFDINKTVMRCLTKNLAMFGLGLYIYAGEDLPEEPQQQAKELMTDEQHHKLKRAYEFYKEKKEESKMLFISDMLDNEDAKHYQRVMDTYKVDSAKKVLTEEKPIEQEQNGSLELY
jgi:hypothetical protein